MKVKRQGYPESFRKTMREIEHRHVEVGFFPEATYPDGTPVAYIAAIHEFGYPQGNIPARSYFRPTVDKESDNWGRQFAGAMAGAIKGEVEFTGALEMIGGMAAGDVAKTMKQLTRPPLSEETIRRKGHSKLLVDSGTLFQSITHKVSK